MMRNTSAMFVTTCLWCIVMLISPVATTKVNGAGGFPDLTPYNPIFDSYPDSAADNMPLGTGETVANVWVDSATGGLNILIGRSDSVSGYMKTLKLTQLLVTWDRPIEQGMHVRGGAARAAGDPLSHFTKMAGKIVQQPPSKTISCSSNTACPDEAAAACLALPGCQGFSVDPNWGASAELTTLSASTAQDNPAWTAYYLPPNPLSNFTRLSGKIVEQPPMLRYNCSSSDTCVEEAAAACLADHRCQGFSFDPEWSDGMAAEFTGGNQETAQDNPAWTAYYIPKPPSNVTSFRQELLLSNGTVQIQMATSAFSINVTVWPVMDRDISGLDGFRVDVATSEAVTTTVTLQPWRKEGPTSVTASSRGLCTSQYLSHEDKISNSYGQLQFSQRNEESIYSSTLTNQSLAHVVDVVPDPLINLTYGGLITGDGFQTSTASNKSIVSKTTSTACSFNIFTYTRQTKDIEEWNSELDRLANYHPLTQDPEMAKAATEGWWETFWNRSWIIVTNSSDPSSGGPTGAAGNVTQAYILQRYLAAIQSRGKFPIHHNGGTVTWGYNGKSSFNPDDRNWGSGYWFQNTRHMYWPLLSSGDAELFMPLFKMYVDQIPVQQERSKRWWSHNGSSFAETAYFFGTYEPVDYGCGRVGEPDCVNKNIKHHYEGGPELAFMMLEAFSHFQDAAVLETMILPWCDSLLTFYDEHYPKDPNGTIFLKDAQSCETYPHCDNPAAQVSGLHRVTESLLNLPNNLTSSAQKEFYTRIKNTLPNIPVQTGQYGPQVMPCLGGYPSEHVNSENVEMYSVWPFEFFSVNRTDNQSDIGMNTFKARKWPGNSAWRYDAQDAALLGLGSEAWNLIVDRVMNEGTTQGSKFPGYLATDPSDGAPQVESGGIVATTLAKMLVQTDKEKILIFPAWLKGLDVSLKLSLPMSTTLTLVYTKGVMQVLDVMPPARGSDVVIISPK